MRINTAFNIGETVWAAARYYSDKLFTTESQMTCFYKYKLLGEFTIDKIQINIIDNKTVIDYFMKELGEDFKIVTLPEDMLYYDKEIAEDTVRVGNALAEKSH